MSAAALVFALLWSPAVGYINNDDYENSYCFVEIMDDQGRTDNRVTDLCAKFGVTVEFTSPVPRVVSDNQEIALDYRIELDTNKNSSLITAFDRGIWHANLHACRSSVGTCTPFLDATGDLIIASDMQKENFTNENDSGVLVADFSDKITLSQGDYTVIAHLIFTTYDTSRSNGFNETTFNESDPNTQRPSQQYDAAVGAPILVEPSLEYLGTDAEIVMVTFVCLSYIYYLVLLYLAVFRAKKAMVVHDETWLTISNILGGIIFTSTIWFWNLYMRDASCAAYLNFFALGFALLFAPIFIKAFFLFFFDPQHLSLAHLRSPKGNAKTTSHRHKTAIFIFSTIVGLNVILLIVLMAAGRPTGVDFGDSLTYREYLDVCDFPNEGLVVAGMIAGMNGILVIVGTLMAWCAHREGFHRGELNRVRRATSIVATCGLVVLIIQLAFREDGIFLFVARSLAIIIAGIGGTHWLCDAIRERGKMDKLAQKGAGLWGDGDSYSSTKGEVSGSRDSNADVNEITKKMTFQRLFESRIIRGYLGLHCRESLDPESVEFCSAVFAFKENPSIEKAQEIVDYYIKDDGPQQVNIGFQLMEKTLKRFEEAKKLQEKLRQDISMTSLKSTQTKYTEDDQEEKLSLLAPKEEAKGYPRIGAGETTLAQRQLAQQKLLRIFDLAFKESRKLVYTNNWRTFRESDSGVAAASWFEWMEYVDGHTSQEQTWALYDLRRKVEHFVKAERVEIERNRNGTAGKGSEGKDRDIPLASIGDQKDKTEEAPTRVHTAFKRAVIGSHTNSTRTTASKGTANKSISINVLPSSNRS